MLEFTGVFDEDRRDLVEGTGLGGEDIEEPDEEEPEEVGFEDEEEDDTTDDDELEDTTEDEDVDADAEEESDSNPSSTSAIGSTTRTCVGFFGTGSTSLATEDRFRLCPRVMPDFVNLAPPPTQILRTLDVGSIHDHSLLIHTRRRSLFMHIRSPSRTAPKGQSSRSSKSSRRRINCPA